MKPISLAEANVQYESSVRLREFVEMCRFQMLARGKGTESVRIAKTHNASSRVLAGLMQKADAGSTATGSATNWGEELSALSQAFIESLTTTGAFDRALPSMRLMPTQVRISLTVGAAVGEEVAQGTIKRISELTLANATLTERRVQTTIVIAVELARLAGPQGLQLLQSQLRNATSTASDRLFVNTLSGGLTPIPSTGDPLADLSAAVESISPTGDTSALVAVLSSLNIKKLALWRGPTGGLAYPGLSATCGGLIAGIQILPSLAMADDQMLVFDAQAIAANGGRALPSGSHEAVITMDDDSGAITISLFGTNSVALRVERVGFGFELMYPTGAALVDSISYANTGS